MTAARSRRRTDSAVAASSRFATTIPSIMSSATASGSAAPQLDRDHRPVAHAPDRPGRARPTGRAAERGHLEPRLTALGREEPRHGRKSGRRHPLHPCTLPRGCDTALPEWPGLEDAPMRTTVRWRSPHDREIVRLALPAFGALIAEPLYLLADTAIVGHLGTRPLGGIAIAAIVLTATFGIFNFLAYTTTGDGGPPRRRGRRARRRGARDRRHLARGRPRAGPHGRRACSRSRSSPSVMGASDAVRPYAAEYLRISLLGAPFVLVALACAGYLRGAQDTRTTLLVAVGANVANLAIELVLVYGFDTGIAGSAWGTVVAQVGRGAGLRRDRARPGRGPARPASRRAPRASGPRRSSAASSWSAPGRCSRALLATTAVASRISDTALASHQIAFQIWAFLALDARRDRDRRAGARRPVPRRRRRPGRAHRGPPHARARRRRGDRDRRRSSPLTRPWLVVPFTTDTVGPGPRRAGPAGSSRSSSRWRRRCSCSTASSSARATPGTWRSRWWRPRSSTPGCSRSRSRPVPDCSGSGRRSRSGSACGGSGSFLRYRSDRWIVTGTVRTP